MPGGAINPVPHNCRRMMLRNALAPILLCLTVCAFSTLPACKMATVLDSQTLRPSQSLTVPVYSPGGQPISAISSLQHLSLSRTQLVILGDDFAYIVDPGASRPVTKLEQVADELDWAANHPCHCTPGQQVMFYENKDAFLYILDADGNLCHVAVIKSYLIALAKR